MVFIASASDNNDVDDSDHKRFTYLSQLSVQTEKIQTSSSLTTVILHSQQVYMTHYGTIPR